MGVTDANAKPAGSDPQDMPNAPPGADHSATDPLRMFAEMQHWTEIAGRAQQKLLEFALSDFDPQPWEALTRQWMPPRSVDQWAQAFSSGMQLWRQWEAGVDSLSRFGAGTLPAIGAPVTDDRRFSDPAWQNDPRFSLIRQYYEYIAAQMLHAANAVDSDDPRDARRTRFLTQTVVDALSPTNIPWINPAVIEKTLQTRGENLLRGLDNILADIKAGRLSQVDRDAFEIGRDIAVTPGKVIFETPLFELIQYAPTTDTVHETPLLIFPPWINRFYILDLNPAKSFVRYCVEQGFTTFMVSWKSGDASMADIAMDDYVRAQSVAIDVVRQTLDVGAVHAVGYCVGGTTLAATLAVIAARGQADKVASATFFTTQVDFSDAGDLALFIEDHHLAMFETLSQGGFLDGRYLAATFNLLRGRDLIWSYVVNHYLLGEDYPAFDLLYWNGDTTNLPARWFNDYLKMLYRDNLLVRPGAITVDGVPVVLGRIETPCYIQAARDDHIAPAKSVWKTTYYIGGPSTFVLAGSGHIAGVVNPPAQGKYQYWTNDRRCESLDSFIAGAVEHRGSWWPHWIAWLDAQTLRKVPANGARIPGADGAYVVRDAPGLYVKLR